MSGIDVVRRLHRYRAWCHDQLLEAARELSPEDLHQPSRTGQGSLWSSLVRLFDADRAWLDALLGRPESRPTRPSDLPALAAAWIEVERGWDDLLTELEDATLDETVTRVDPLGNRLTAEALDVHLHLGTQAAFTAAQVVEMLRGPGASSVPDLTHLKLAAAEGRVSLSPVIAGESR